jgi:DnaJ-class molecular chaperone
MSAEYEDVLGVRATAPEKDKTKARNVLAQTYHPDQLDLQDDFLRFLATERMKEINFAYDRLKKPKK